MTESQPNSREVIQNQGIHATVKPDKEEVCFPHPLTAHRLTAAHIDRRPPRCFPAGDPMQNRQGCRLQRGTGNKTQPLSPSLFPPCARQANRRFNAPCSLQLGRTAATLLLAAGEFLQRLERTIFYTANYDLIVLIELPLAHQPQVMPSCRPAPA